MHFGFNNELIKKKIKNFNRYTGTGTINGLSFKMRLK